jgi:hypothetical protein
MAIKMATAALLKSAFIEDTTAKNPANKPAVVEVWQQVNTARSHIGLIILIVHNVVII